MTTRKKNNPFDRLYAAATEIADTARGALKDCAQQPGDLYIPVIIKGTDMRICIECGPRVHASNVIAHAQGQSGGTPAMRFEEAVRQATDLLAQMAHSADSKQQIDHIAAVIAGLRGTA